MDNNIEQKISDFFSKYRLIRFKKGEIIYRPGDEFSQVSFVKNGYVRLFTESKTGKEITINLFKPVFYLSLAYSINKKCNRYYFEAVTDVEIWKAPYEDVKKFLRSTPKIHEWLNSRLLNIIDELISNIGETISEDSYTKIARTILSFALKFSNNSNSSTIEFQTSHRIIASLVGISRETASVQIKKMENEGLIKQNNRRIIIPDIKKLQEISGL